MGKRKIMKTGLPVDFSVLIGEKKIGASLVSIEKSNDAKIFVVRFADGYEDGFYLDNIVRGVNEKQSLAYAEALKDEIPVFNFLQKDMAVKNFEFGHIGYAFVNAWIFRQQRTEDFLYSFYLAGDYIFDTWCTDGVWSVLTGDKLYPLGIDDKWLKMVTEQIGEEPVIEKKPEPIKPIEFPLLFNYQGQQLFGLGILSREKRPHQCYVMVKTEDPNDTLLYQFLKVDQKGKIFDWKSTNKKYDKMAKAIAKALEQQFSTKIFSTN